MPSLSQIQANRENALRSTGPRSLEGKAACARNALKHGLRSRDVVLTGVESPTGFDELRQSFHQRFAPADSIEHSLVDRIVAAEWRLRRIRRIETAMFFDRLMDAGVEEVREDPEHADDAGSYEVESQILHDAYQLANDQLEQLSRYEAQLERSIERSIRQLQQLRKAPELRAGESEPPDPPAEAAALTPSANPNEQSQSAVAAGPRQASSLPHRLALVRPVRPTCPGGMSIPAGTTFSNG